MSTADKNPANGGPKSVRKDPFRNGGSLLGGCLTTPVPGPYVSCDVCEAFRQEQRDANTRTWQEIRTLRRLVILLVVGGQLFSGGLNVASVAYWLEQHAARPHASTVEMVAAARDEARQDVRDVRREMYELVRSVMPRSGEPMPFAGPNEGDTE